MLRMLFNREAMFFLFISFECFAQRVVIIDVKNYPKVHFEEFLAAISTRNVSFKTLKRVYLGFCLILVDTNDIIL